MDIPIGDAFVIPDAELQWTFTTTGGPGGQHANRSATGVELRWDIAASSAIDDEIRARIIENLSLRVRNGVATVTAGESRSQWRNRQTARRRLAKRVEAGLRTRPPRTPTRPSRSAIHRRIGEKRRRSATKRLRRPPDLDS